VPVNDRTLPERYISAVQESTRDFAAEAASVRAARRFASEVAEQWRLGEQAWPLVQIVSELASNAVIHARTAFTVCLSHDGGATRIEVIDHSGRRARSRGYDLDATTGRGLRLVETLSREWGVSTRGSGKAVWAVVDATSFAEEEPEALAELFLAGPGDDDVAVKTPRSRAQRAPGSRASLPLAA
jgi:anti-sigma regulatory factor (Ser/Thr protein kinase)